MRKVGFVKKLPYSVPLEHSINAFQKKSVSRSFINTSPNKKIVITTPIFYVNSSPHIGHLYTCLIADSIARFQRLKGNKTHFITGTDEHGLKIQQAAEKANTDPSTFCARVSEEFRSLFDKANISYDDYIRTTEPRHAIAVNHFWKTLLDKGFINKGRYEGWYCISDESFLTEDQVKDGFVNGEACKVSVESGHRVEWVTEQNYMFKLSTVKNELLQWLLSNPGLVAWLFPDVTDIIVPKTRYTEIVKLLERFSLGDLSVSRGSARVKWALPVPDDPSQSIYVWLDALTNYMTSAGYPSDQFYKTWPPDYMIMGKDILKFHAVYFPAFLMAAGYKLPLRLIAHSHWLVNGVKMSKSLGNVVNPGQLIEQFGVDPVRFYLLLEGGISEDGDFSHERLFIKLKGELADNFGNLVARCTSPGLNPQSVVPSLHPEALTADDQEFIGLLKSLKLEENFSVVDISKGINHVMNIIRHANKYFQKHEPWKLKNPENFHHLQNLLYITMEAIRISSILLQPIMPASMTAILNHLGIPLEERLLSHAEFGQIKSGMKLIQIKNFKAFQIPDTITQTTSSAQRKSKINIQ